LTIPFTDWPEWARALKREEERQRENERERIDAGIDVLLFSEMGDHTFRGDKWEVGIGWNGYRVWEGV